MSKFNTFARRLDAHAREVFAKREELEAAYNKAERASKEARASGNPIAIARADADLLEAKNARDSMRRALRDDSGAEIANIRKELAAELDGAFAADPADLDTATLELLKSGILTAAEYSRLMDSAAEAGNATMCRMIGQYAKTRSDEETAKRNPDTAREFARIAHRGRMTGADAYLANFDTLTEVYNRAVKNPALVPHWDELTGEMVEGF